MSGRRIERALARLATANAVLAPEREGAGFGVYAHGDRRRRPLVRLSAADVRSLEAEGAISAVGEDTFTLNDAGRARVQRSARRRAKAFWRSIAPSCRVWRSTRTATRGACAAMTRMRRSNA
jgi:hypothetical protein